LVWVPPVSSYFFTFQSNLERVHAHLVHGRQLHRGVLGVDGGVGGVRESSRWWGDGAQEAEPPKRSKCLSAAAAA